ncbi:MAG: phosphatase PAP2 family protein [Patescibacteria group bacterium]|nr:phosphatase PAP2 family protein [Patescibacteria group bacterium]
MNENIFYFFSNLVFRNEMVDMLIVFLADWLIWWMIFFVAVLFFLKKISFKIILKILTATLAAWLISKLIKHFYFSPRPFVLLTDIKTLFTHGLNDSFPSGHTTFAFALATAISLFSNWKTGLFFFVSAILIGLSRITVGIHWPLDILGGLVLGVIISSIFYFLQKTKVSRFNDSPQDKTSNV